MNPLSAWLDFWAKLIDPNTKIKECYFCHGGIPPLDTPLYILLEDSNKRVSACWYCFKAHENQPETEKELVAVINQIITEANSIPKEVEIAISTPLDRKIYAGSAKRTTKSSFQKFIDEFLEFYEEPMARLPDNEQYTNRFEIPSSNGKKLYKIAQHKTTKVWSCSCTGWIAHHKPCKHLKSTEAERMKLEKSTFGAKNKDFNGPSGNPDAWKNILNEGISQPEIEITQIATRKIKIKEQDHGGD